MAMTKTLQTYKQDTADVNKMLAYYAAHFTEVYSLTCLQCNRVIGVEIAPVRADGIVLEKGRTFYSYGDLCLSMRKRLDLNDQGLPMYGYQCVCGNNTLLAEVEKGEVPTRTILQDKAGNVVGDTGPIAPATPYELEQANITIKLKAASKKADYETDGTMERYETFKLERVK